MPVSRFGNDLYSLLLDLSTQSDELFIQLQFVDALNRFDDSIQFEYSGISLNKTGITIPIESLNYKFGFLVASPTLAQQTTEFQNLVISSVRMLAAILEKVRNRNQQTDTPKSVENTDMVVLVKTAPTSDERYRQLIELSSDGVILTNEQGIIIEWNKSQESITGWSAEECIGKYLWDVRWRYMPQNLRTPETLTRLREATRRAMSTGQSTVFREPYEAEIECKDGTRRFEEVLSYPVATENGYMVGILTRDVTQRKITETELKRREAVLNAVRYSGEILISATSWKEHAQDILKHLGEALDVGRTYIFENHTDGKKLFFSQRYEWCAPGVTPQIDNQLLQNCDLNDGALTNFRRTLEAGDILAGKPSDFSAEEQQFLDGQDILYMASAPIFAGDDWWGFIGFDDLESTRDLDAIEREVAEGSGNKPWKHHST